MDPVNPLLHPTVETSGIGTAPPSTLPTDWRPVLRKSPNTEETTPHPDAAVRALSPGLWQRLALAGFERVLNPLPMGRLSVQLPNQNRLVLGGGHADGPEASVRVHDWRFFGRCLKDGDIGLGETYQDGWWDSPDLPSVVGWFCANADSSPNVSGSQYKNRLVSLLQKPGVWWRRLEHATRRNNVSGSRKNIRAHYDLGNAFYQLWLDSSLTYSSALFESPDQSLESAQTAKYDRLCRLLRLQPTDRVLEIGSGWGGFAVHAIRNYGCRVTTITLSEEQARHVRLRFEQEGMTDRAQVLLTDYRRVTGQFDKIVSIEMLEAVGDQYLETYFDRIQRWLGRDGLFAAQFITCPDSRYRSLRRGVDWIQRHIFPGSLLLSLNRVHEAMQRTGRLQLHDLCDMGTDYARTLRLWRIRFLDQLEAVRAQGFDDRFIRTWDYYLAYCEAAFDWRNISVIQGLWTGPNNRQLMDPQTQSV